MAGFDKVDPANACFLSSAVHRVYGPRMTIEWVSQIIEKCQYAGCTKEFLWSAKMSCTSKPQAFASFVC